MAQHALDSPFVAVSIFLYASLFVSVFVTTAGLIRVGISIHVIQEEGG
jgi:hypothetical protein